MFITGIYKNGWFDSSKNNKNNKFRSIFCMSAIPVIRNIIVVTLFIMFIYPKEKVESYVNELKGGK
jgi:hypothetical protein